jgi:hypothetical protein
MIVVIDNGLYLPLAVALARAANQTVGYHCGWRKAFPSVRDTMVGDGVKGIETVLSIEEMNADDLFVFPDLYWNPMQKAMAEAGAKVFGAGIGMGELPELDRAWFLEELDRAGQPVPKWEVAEGLKQLRAMLDKKSDVFVKLSGLRGDMETHHHKQPGSSRLWLDQLALQIGGGAEAMEWIVQDAIKEKCEEVGVDAFVCDGEFVTPCLVGIEKKDTAYFGVVAEQWKDVPEALRGPSEVFSQHFKRERYRCFHSNELRVSMDGPLKVYYIDATCRMPEPPGCAMLSAIENIDEVVIGIAAGKAVQPKFRGRFVAQIVMQSTWLEHNWLEVEYPEKFADRIFLKRCCVVDGRKYLIPDASGMTEMIDAVGWGDEPEEAMEIAKEAAAAVQGEGISYNEGALEEAAESLAKVLERVR